MNYYLSPNGGWLILVALFLAAVFFIRYLHFFVGVVYLKKPDNHSLSVSVSFFKRFKLYTFQISPPDFLPGVASGACGVSDTKPGDGENSGTPAEKRRNPPRGEDNFNLHRRLWDKLAAHLYFEKFRLQLTYGFEDAALTGVSSGVLAAFRGVFLAVCGTYLKMREEPDISFSPIYGRDRLEVEFDCIFSIRLGKVIAITASVLTSFFANKANIQGGEARWRNILFRT